MIISSIEELRLYSPSSALDNIDVLQGFLNSSELDFLRDKLGDSLWMLLREYYRNLVSDETGISVFIQHVTIGTDMPPYAQLLNLAQRMVVFDALSNAIDLQAISVNGAGVNIAVANDYQKADREAISAYKNSCVKQAHIALNSLLILLETWTKQIAQAEVVGDDTVNEEIKEIVEAWRNDSRYYFLAANLIIPSAVILQEYLDIYESREKYITMLPDLRYIQEDVIEPIIGEDLMHYLVEKAIKGTNDKLLCRIIHNLRKCVARELESRTMTLKVGTPRRETAHNEAVKLADALVSYIKTHQTDFDEEGLTALKQGPLYVDAKSVSETSEPLFENNSSDAVMFVTPALN